MPRRGDLGAIPEWRAPSPPREGRGVWGGSRQGRVGGRRRGASERRKERRRGGSRGNSGSDVAGRSAILLHWGSLAGGLSRYCIRETRHDRGPDSRRLVKIHRVADCTFSFVVAVYLARAPLEARRHHHGRESPLGQGQELGDRRGPQGGGRGAEALRDVCLRARHLCMGFCGRGRSRA